MAGALSGARVCVTSLQPPLEDCGLCNRYRGLWGSAAHVGALGPFRRLHFDQGRATLMGSAAQRASAWTQSPTASGQPGTCLMASERWWAACLCQTPPRHWWQADPSITPWAGLTSLQRTQRCLTLADEDIEGLGAAGSDSSPCSGTGYSLGTQSNTRLPCEAGPQPGLLLFACPTAPRP